MAGMFYSLQQVIERLNKTEQQIKEMVKAGRLREFRDGPNLLFKTDEVEALMADTSIMASPETPTKAEPQPEPEAELEIEPTAEPETKPATEPEPTAEPQPEPKAELKIEPTAEQQTKPATEPEPTAEPQPEPEAELKIEPTAEPETKPATEPEPTAEPQPEPKAEPEIEQIAEQQTDAEQIASDTGQETAIVQETDTPQQADEDVIPLAPEVTEGPAAESGLTSADTSMAGEGIDVLGETDRDYQVTDDTMGETKAVSGDTSLGAMDEASLEEIEEDVNLDSFGSGSGLLDLSLQADDTSLGGILDEIYTPDGEEGEPTPAAGSAVEVAAEAEQMLPKEDFAAPQLVPEATAMARAYIEPEPDTLSNAFGIMLFLPLLVVVYTAIVTVAGFSNMMPTILEYLQGMVWYIMGGIAFVAIMMVGIPLLQSAGGSKAAKKPKAKKAGKPKPKKEKKPKKKKDKKAKS